METCAMCDGVGCEWCVDGTVPADMLFVPPGDLPQGVRRKTKPAQSLASQPHDFKLFAFRKSVPSYHLVKMVNEYGSAFTWCGKVGREMPVEPGQVPRCVPCEKARHEDSLTAKQQVESRRAEKQ